MAMTFALEETQTPQFLQYPWIWSFFQRKCLVSNSLPDLLSFEPKEQGEIWISTDFPVLTNSDAKEDLQNPLLKMKICLFMLRKQTHKFKPLYNSDSIIKNNIFLCPQSTGQM